LTRTLCYVIYILHVAYHLYSLFLFNHSATTQTYNLSPTRRSSDLKGVQVAGLVNATGDAEGLQIAGLMNKAGNANTQIAGLINVDRKSTRLNSSHVKISYAVFCLKKKKK